MRKKTRTLLIGKKMTRFAFGLVGGSHGMYSGGYNNWMYGIKGILGIQILESWGK